MFKCENCSTEVTAIGCECGDYEPGQDRAPEGKTMKLIEKNQLIGTGDGFMHYRDLYEKEDGARVSVRTSKHLEVA